MRTSRCTRALFLLAVLCGWTMRWGVSEGKVEAWVVGGQILWSAHGSWVAVSDTTVPGSIQPREFNPNENIIPTLGRQHYGRTPLDNPEFRKGEHMRLYIGSSGAGAAKLLIDADSTTFDGWQLMGGPSATKYFVTLDTGFPVYANRFVFYPPQRGTDAFSTPYRESYMGGYELSASVVEPDFLPTEGGSEWSTQYHLLPNVLKRAPHNFDSIVEEIFPLQKLRFLRLRSTSEKGFVLAEIELYGEGFAPKAVYRSKVIDLDRPVNFGSIAWRGTTLRQRKMWERTEGRWEVVGGDVKPVPGPDAPVSVTIETMSGTDPDPLVYHKIGDMLEEVVVTQSEYERLYAPPSDPNLPILPEQRGSVTRDVDHWSLWANPVGGKIASPGPRQFFQFQITLASESPWYFVRIDSVLFTYSSPLARDILGEVAALRDPTPQENIPVVNAGEPITFTYDLRTEFDSPDQGGFDALRITVPPQTVFEALQMGPSLQSVAPKDMVVTSDKLTVYLPDKITRDHHSPIRLIFTTQVLNYISRFVGEALDTQGADFPQSITPGDATDAVSTNTLTVLASESSLQEVLSSVALSPRCMTPNGDGVNDQAVISYTILQAREAQVDIILYDLSGKHVMKFSSQGQPAGRYDRSWDGRDEEGRLVPPGTYLCKVSVETDKGIAQTITPLVVVY